MTSELFKYWPVALGVLLALIALIVLLRRRGQRVELGSIDPVIAPTLARSPIADPVAAEASEPIPAITTVATVATVATGGPPDDLRRIKGLGPKVAAQLERVGITRFDQLAGLGPDEQAALDARLGAFAGRMARDRWVEQARLLAHGDVVTFEAQFGKLG